MTVEDRPMLVTCGSQAPMSIGVIRAPTRSEEVALRSSGAFEAALGQLAMTPPGRVRLPANSVEDLAAPERSLGLHG
jgi:hypothetical protein